MQNGIEKAGGYPFPVCEILGVPVSVTNMEQVTGHLEKFVNQLRGRYVCVGNVHTTVMAFEDEHYMQVQRGAAFVLPDGKPLSARSRKRGFPEAARVTGPDLMKQMLQEIKAELMA